MKSSHLIFTLCAISTPMCYSMQLTLKTNPQKIKQIRYITSHKELQTTAAKTKKRKENQCNNCCIVEKKEQIKDLVMQTFNTLQSRFFEYNSKYGSRFFVEDSCSNGFLAANIVLGMGHVGCFLAYAHPAFLIPIITNVAATKLIKLDTDLINSVKQPELARDLISYLSALNVKGLMSAQGLLSQQCRIENEIRDHKRINTQTLSSLDLKTALNDYNAKLVELEKSKDMINGEILEPILPILNKYKNVDIEECLAYKNKLNVIAARKIGLFMSGGFVGAMYSIAALSAIMGNPTIYPLSPLLSILTIPIWFGVLNNDLQNKTDIVSRYLKTYKDHLKTIKNNASTKTIKNKKNTE